MIPFLTVGIPTYNGSQRIRSALDSILVQGWGHASGLEIVVSDNGSTDEINEVIEEYQRRFPGIVFFYQNEKNLGYDRNVARVFECARGEYVWLFGDDDLQNSEALKTLVQFLQEQRPDLALVNFDLYDETMTTLLHSLRINSGANRLCSDADDFLVNSGGRYGNLSSIVIKRDVWNTCDLSGGFGSNYIHCFALFCLLPFWKSSIVSTPLFKARAGSTNFEQDSLTKIAIPARVIPIIKMLKTSGVARQIWKRMLREQRTYVFSRLVGVDLYSKNGGLSVLAYLLRHNYDSSLFYRAITKSVFSQLVSELRSLYRGFFPKGS